MDDFNYYFGMRVSDFRRLNGLTQRELAERMDVSTSFICKMEQGVKFPTLPNCIELASCLGVHLDWLFELDGPFGKAPSRLLQLAHLPRRHRMERMNQMKKIAEENWNVVGASITQIYGCDPNVPWKSTYWKVFALFFVLQLLEKHRSAAALSCLPVE